LVALGALVLLVGCSGKTTGTTSVTYTAATLNGTGSCGSGETCKWYWEYWKASQARSTSIKTPVEGPVRGPIATVNLSKRVTGLSPNTAYRWVMCGSPNNGANYQCAGPQYISPTTDDPPRDYETFRTTPNDYIFHQGSDIVRLNADGTGPTAVPNTNGQNFNDPQASPDGRKLAVMKDGRIATMSTSGPA